MTTALEAAILAMDAYNRGVGNKGIVVSNNSAIGTFNIDLESSVGSFYGASYVSGGETVIAYRGTDNFPGDIFTGWIGAPGLLTPQDLEAAKFYRSVNNGSAGPNITFTLTGHSLGGRLAGFVGSIYGTQATIFDNEPYELTAANLYNSAKTNLVAGVEVVLNPTLRQDYFLGSEPPTPREPLSN